MTLSKIFSWFNSLIFFFLFTCSYLCGQPMDIDDFSGEEKCDFFGDQAELIVTGQINANFGGEIANVIEYFSKCLTNDPSVSRGQCLLCFAVLYKSLIADFIDSKEQFLKLSFSDIQNQTTPHVEAIITNLILSIKAFHDGGENFFHIHSYLIQDYKRQEKDHFIDLSKSLLLLDRARGTFKNNIKSFSEIFQGQIMMDTEKYALFCKYVNAVEINILLLMKYILNIELKLSRSTLEKSFNNICLNNAENIEHLYSVILTYVTLWKTVLNSRGYNEVQQQLDDWAKKFLAFKQDLNTTQHTLKEKQKLSETHFFDSIEIYKKCSSLGNDSTQDDNECTKILQGILTSINNNNTEIHNILMIQKRLAYQNLYEIQKIINRVMNNDEFGIKNKSIFDNLNL